MLSMYVIPLAILIIIVAMIWNGLSSVKEEISKEVKQKKSLAAKYDANLERVRQIRFHIREKNGEIIQIKQETGPSTRPTTYANYYSFFIDSDPRIYTNIVKIELLDAAGNVIPSERYSIKKQDKEEIGAFFLDIY